MAVKFLGNDLHKFLGRLIATNLTSKGAYKLTREFFLSALEKVDGALISGPSKAWIYQFYILAILSWPFLIYPFSVSDIRRDFEGPATRLLKKWYKLAKPANSAILFLPKSLNGMELTSPVEKFKSLQVSALHHLSNSVDPMVSSLAAASRVRDSLSRSNKWKPAAALSSAESVLDFNFAFRGQTGSAGLGFSSRAPRRKAASPMAARRSDIAAIVKKDESDARIARLRACPLAGNFLKWDNNLISSVSNWDHQILGMSEAEFSFILNAQARPSLTHPTSAAGIVMSVLGACCALNRPPLPSTP